jgi:2-iminobutanoate/2-iminopropanoate deaminase
MTALHMTVAAPVTNFFSAPFEPIRRVLPPILSMQLDILGGRAFFHIEEKPMIEALTSENLPPPRFRYSPLVKAGPFLKTAGMVALDKDSGELQPGGAGPETAKILANLLDAMPDFGLTLAHLMSATIFTTEFDQFPAINASWEAVFTPDVQPPARTAVGVNALPLGAAVEMEFIFYKAD